MLCFGANADRNAQSNSNGQTDTLHGKMRTNSAPAPDTSSAANTASVNFGDPL